MKHFTDVFNKKIASDKLNKTKLIGFVIIGVITLVVLYLFAGQVIKSVSSAGVETLSQKLERQHQEQVALDVVLNEKIKVVDDKFKEVDALNASLERVSKELGVAQKEEDVARQERNDKKASIDQLVNPKAEPVK